MKENESKSMQGTEDLGLVDRQKFDASAPLRKETSEESQRPVHSTSSMKTDRGTFKTKG